MPELNWLAVIVTAVIGIIISATWFNAPFAFNKIWLEGIDKTSEQVAADASPLSIVGAVIGTLITSLVLALLIEWLGATTLTGGITVGLLAAVAFAPNLAIIKDLFERRPFRLTLINAAHDVVILAVMGGILGLWQ